MKHAEVYMRHREIRVAHETHMRHTKTLVAYEIHEAFEEAYEDTYEMHLDANRHRFMCIPPERFPKFDFIGRFVAEKSRRLFEKTPPLITRLIAPGHIGCHRSVVRFTPIDTIALP